MKIDLKYVFFSTFLLLLIGCGGGTTTEEPGDTGQQNINQGDALDRGLTDIETIQIPRAPIPVASASESDLASLSWQAPTENMDGTPLLDLAGYYIYYGKVDDYGKVDGALIDVVDIQDAAALAHTLAGIRMGDYFFAISAYNLAGTESKKVAVVTTSVN